MIIYKVTNLVNGKVYIGLTTKTLNIRRNAHISEAYNNNSQFAFHNALRKYGIENFTWEVIDQALTRNELSQKEIYWIDFYNSYANSKNSNGYNLTFGGDGGWGWIPNEETRQKMRIVNTGESNPFSKLTDEKVLEIKELIKSKVPMVKIAKDFDVCNGTILDIKSGKSWSHIGEDVSDIKYPNIKNSKLTEDQVIKIKLLLIENKVKIKDIANTFGVSIHTISNIKSGAKWKNTGEDISQIAGKRKLTENEVREIKLLLKEGNLTQKEISYRYNVASSLISRINSGKVWSNIT